jgi:uncharacterized protein
MPPTPANSKDSEGEVVTRSTKEPLKLKSTSYKGKMAKEEYQLIKGLAASIAQRQKRKMQDCVENAHSSFGSYVAQTLSEMEPRMKYMAQHKISDILFQAQSGTLGQYQHTGTIPQQPQFVQKFPQQNNWMSGNQYPTDAAAGSSTQLFQQQNSWLNQLQSSQSDVNMVNEPSDIHITHL